MRAFIVRPFGTKSGIDFDRVEAELIDPALEQLEITGRTTGEIAEQGNIRTDMFQRLLTADVVVADISIHNANVFYELGIRHALRDCRTLLIRCSGDDVPFDLKTDRYLAYDRDNPAEALERLVRALRDTVDSESRDSPVFQLLPALQPPDRTQFLVVPTDFREAVQAALATKNAGDLELLAEEVGMLGFEWEEAGLRLAGRAQFDLRLFEGARETWEAIRRRDADDVEANTRLGTILQRLGDLAGSRAALERARDNPQVKSAELAEVYALLGSNAKERWKQEWSAAAAEEQARKALLSPFLERSWEDYESGFRENLNHYYSGLNALALLAIRIHLAESLAEEWAGSFESDDKAEAELERLRRRRELLSAAVEIGLDAARGRGDSDVWQRISVADHAFLTSDRRGFVASRYREALIGAPPFAIQTVSRQLELYHQLGILSDNVKAVSEILTTLSTVRRIEAKAASPVGRVLVFTGHMIDAPDRPQPRFPPRAEAVAREMIRDAVAAEAANVEGAVIGFAGAAAGGDILFHEVCKELNVETRLLLALPRDRFVKASVERGGPAWIDRFDALLERLEERELQESSELPKWMRTGSHADDYNVWQRNNLWILHHALAEGAARASLIALWDGEAGDGPGGTQDMVRKARDRGAKAVILDAKKLLAEAPSGG